MAKPSPSRSDLKYLFKPTVSLSKAERKKKKRGFALAAGLLLALVQLVLTVLFQITIFRLDMLPAKYLIVLNIILILVFLYDLTSQFSRSHILGKLISILLSVLILFHTSSHQSLIRYYLSLATLTPLLILSMYVCLQATKQPVCQIP